MKLQCPCGAKYAFDVTPDMVANPVRFVCPACGLDSSAFVNEMIRQEFTPHGAPAAVAASTPAIATPPPSPVAQMTPPPPPVRARLAVAHHAPAAQSGPGDSTATDATVTCPKHKGIPALERCRICQKPICPKCMEIFGYVCSALCKAKAASHGIAIPEYAGQKSVVEGKRWRKIVMIASAVTVLVVGLLGVWFWYAWFGSVPHPIFSVRFPDIAYAGSSQLCGDKQFVFLHGGTLARYPVNSKTPAWSVELISKQDLAAAVQKRNDEIHKRIQRFKDDPNLSSDMAPRIPLPQDLERFVQTELETSLHLFVQNSNVWVDKVSQIEKNNEFLTEHKLTEYDWNTGTPGKVITLVTSYGTFELRGSELLLVERNSLHQEVLTHLDLASGNTNKEEIGEPIKVEAASTKTPAGAAGKRPNPFTAGRNTGNSTGDGLPTVPGANDGKPLDPQKVAAEAQRLSVAGKAALPAVLANVQHQEAILNELKEPGAAKVSVRKEDDPEVQLRRRFIFLPSRYGYVQWTDDLIEERHTSHKAMKEAPKTSALNNNPSMANTADVANEILNEMQRSYGGDVEVEDESRYQVTLRLPEKKDIPDWKGEVIGPPSVVPLKTVNVVCGGKMIVVLDKMNRKLWQADFTYAIPGAGFFGDADESEASTGAGPCVEHGDALYVFDQANLTAFDLASGKVRWRVPSIGIMGLFFDGEDMLYVNSTTAKLDRIKYSRQIDITASEKALVMKIEPKTGKVLWNVQPGGVVSHVEGKYIFCLALNDAGDVDPDSLYTLPGTMPSLMAIRRLNPKNGEMMWHYGQKRCPLDVRFKGNTIELVFKKEVQVLKFLAF